MMLRLKDICLQYGVKPLLDNINLVINNNEKIALLGRNGEGKSTLFKVIAKTAQVDSGEIEYSSGLKIGVLDQDFSKIKTNNIYDIISSGLGEKGKLITDYNKLLKQPNYDLLELEKIQSKIDAANAWDYQNQVDTIISKLNINPELDFQSLSGGLKRRVLLAKSLVQHPDLLLLDEPTNHLDLESIKWLEKFLLNWNTSILFISHDREFVKKVANRIIELDRGKLSDWPGTYQEFLIKKEEFLKNQELENKKFDKKLAEEEVWIRQGIKARRTRNEGRVRALKKLREERANRYDKKGNVNIELHDTKQSGKIVVKADKINFSYNNSSDNTISNFSSIIQRGDKVAIIGPNGCGKTTLINILLDKIKPTSGNIEHGSQLEVAYFDQLREELDDNMSLRDNVSGGSDVVTINGKNKHIIGYLQEFLFTPERANSNIKVLSGGEKNRLLLAKLFTKPSNLLILDEPTNDLDIETLELLEDLLVQYPGTILLISHDREFINNTVTSIISYEGKGIFKEYIGDYNHWELNHSNNAGLTQDKNINKNKDNKTSLAKQNISNQILSYDEQKELKNLPKKIENLENKLSETEAIVADEGFYNLSQKNIDDTLDKIKQIQSELNLLYNKWEDLESRK